MSNKKYELPPNKYASPRWSYELLDCSMPMTFDTYSNCAFGCAYCFSAFQRARSAAKDDYIKANVSSVNVEKVKQLFTDPDNVKGVNKQFAWYVKARHTMQWGGLSDAFDWFEKRYGISLDLLRFFRSIEYPISISTKGSWIMDDERYVEQLRGAEHIHMKVSIITLDEEIAKRIEKGVSSPNERFAMLKKLNEIGVGATTLRFRPIILGVSDIHIEEMVQRAADAGCYSISTEFMCVEGRANTATKARMKALSKYTHYDVLPYYREHSSGQGLLRLNYELKRPYFDRLEEACEKHGVKLFISDAHHKERCYGISCCGIPPEHPALGNYRRGQFTDALLQAKEKGFVRWSDIEEKASGLDNVSYLSAEGYNHGDTLNRSKYRYMTMKDFMRNQWNNTKSVQSPAKYFGGALVSCGLDDRGNVVYLYNRPYIAEGYSCKDVYELAASLGVDLAVICKDDKTNENI